VPAKSCSPTTLPKDWPLSVKSVDKHPTDFKLREGDLDFTG
jgi:hypothetical protein